jgi:hypothetical protein
VVKIRSGIPRFIYREITYTTSKDRPSAFGYLIHAFPPFGDGLSQVEIRESKSIINQSES